VSDEDVDPSDADHHRGRRNRGDAKPSPDVARMRDQLFFEGDDLHRRLTRFWLLLVLAGIIATCGVIGDSTATVIGAMIVAPLMVPILGTVLAVVLTDRTNLIRCLGLVVAGAATVIAIGWLLGQLTPTPIVAATNAQVAARVTPRLVDLVAALATGAVGSIALARDDISDTLPGVAIAISLVPPLAVVGLTLESGAPAQAFGALVLFITNVSAILASGLLVMTIYRIRGTVRPAAGAKSVNRRTATVAIVVALVVIAVPLAVTSSRLNRSQNDETTITTLADTWAGGTGWQIVSVTTSAGTVLIRATGQLPEPETDSLRTAIVGAGLGGTAVSIELVPSNEVTLTGG
jgi:uncharacterized hydrophobic protein (TIGR00271 family)